MNAADSEVDVSELRRRADELELQALRCSDSKRSEQLYERVRALRAEAGFLSARIHATKRFLQAT